MSSAAISAIPMIVAYLSRYFIILADLKTRKSFDYILRVECRLQSYTLSSYRLRLMFVFSDTAFYSKISFIGETVHLSCGDVEASNTKVAWYYQKSAEAKNKAILLNGKLANGDLQGRLSSGGSTIIIENVGKNDSGIYTCIEDLGQGTKYRLLLTVQGTCGE